MTRWRVAERVADPSAAVRAELVRDVQALADVELDLEEDELEAFAAEVIASGPAFLGLVADPDAAVRVATCRVLRELALDDPSDPEGWRYLHDLGVFARTAGTYLTAALGDPDPSVRAAALLTLATVLPSEVKAHVPALLADGEPAVQAALVGALVEIDDPRGADVLVRYLRGAGVHAAPEHVRALHRYVIDGSDARGVLVPLLAADAPEEVRKLAAYALVEHVDASCASALTPLIEQGIEAALVALARLGRAGDSSALPRLLAGSPSPQLLFNAGWAAAACERRDCLPMLLQALGASSRGTFGEFGSPSKTIPWWLLGTVSAFDDPSVFDAAASMAVAPAGPTPPHSAHAENWEYHQRIFEVGTAALALGASGRAEGTRLIQSAAAELAINDALGNRTRTRFALGIALIDPDAVGTGLVEPREPWFQRLYTFEQQVLPIAFSLRLLGRRLRDRARPLTAPAKALVSAAVDFIDTADYAGAIQAYRGRASMWSADAAWIFVIRDVLAEARGLLAPHA